LSDTFACRTQAQQSPHRASSTKRCSLRRLATRCSGCAVCCSMSWWLNKTWVDAGEDHSANQQSGHVRARGTTGPDGGSGVSRFQSTTLGRIRGCLWSGRFLVIHILETLCIITDSLSPEPMPRHTCHGTLKLGEASLPDDPACSYRRVRSHCSGAVSHLRLSLWSVMAANPRLRQKRSDAMQPKFTGQDFDATRQNWAYVEHAMKTSDHKLNRTNSGVYRTQRW